MERNTVEFKDRKLDDVLTSDNTYGCDICGARKDFGKEIVWITSSYGVCEECYNTLTNEDLDKIRKDYE